MHDIVWKVFIDPDYDGIVTWQEVHDSRSRYIEPGVLAQISVERGGAPAVCRSRILRLQQSRSRTTCP